MNVIYNSAILNPVAENKPIDKTGKIGAVKSSASGFQQILENKIDDSKKLQFSKHAEMRLATRAINFTGDQLERIKTGVDKAEEKGIRDSLVLVDDVALVVNVKSKTVITAMDNKKERDNIFTNIDGAVIV